MCFVLLATFSYAQNYQLIQPANEQHFLFTNTSNGPFYQREIRSIRIDSMATQGSENYYYNHKILEDNFTSFCLADHNDSSWVGHQIIQASNGDYIFFNNELDSILIQTLSPLNSTWILYKFGNGNYIEATISTFDTVTILNATDSIKVITLQVKDAANNPITHSMSGQSMQFSKENGWVQFLNFHTFPNDTTPYTLVGSSAQPNVGIQNPTKVDFLNFTVGDEIHTAGEYRMQYQPWRFGQHKKIRTILAKNTSTNQDTITYTYEDCFAGINNDAMAGTYDTIYRTDTIIQQLILSEITGIDQLTHELSSDSMSYNLTSIRDFASTRRQKLSNGGYYYDVLNNCWTLDLDNWSRIWIEGLGGPFLSNMYRSDFPVYYKKGSEIWGTPINCSTFLNLRIISNNNSSIKVFPNPSIGVTNIQIQDFNASDNWSFQLLDVTGKVVRSSTILKAAFILQRENLPLGVYFYQINNAKQKQQYTGKIVLQ